MDGAQVVRVDVEHLGLVATGAADDGPAGARHGHRIGPGRVWGDAVETRRGNYPPEDVTFPMEGDPAPDELT